MTKYLIQAGALALATGFILGTSSVPAAAQVQTQACESQQSMEQILDTDGGLSPDDCRVVTLTRLQSDAGDLCVLDFSGADGGVVDDLLAVARTDQWWVACDSLTEAAAPTTP